VTVIALLYGIGVAVRGSAGGPRRTRVRRGSPMAAATLLLSLLILDEVGGGLVTPAWAVQGLALLVAGFAIRDRVMRLSGLAVLFASLAKLFAHDLNTLEPLPRILSFVVLGLVLLAVSWGYTRYRDTLDRLLKD